METKSSLSASILYGLTANPLTDWHGEIIKMAGLKIDTLALFLRDLPLESRRALYRDLEAAPPRSIPFVQLAADVEEWELRYLVAKYQTESFSLPASDTAFAFAGALAEPLPRMYIENPTRIKDTPLFNESSCGRIHLSGVCLDTAALERNRVSDPKGYETVIRVLDHCSIGAAIISPVSESLLARFAKPSKRLDSLKQLRYLSHLPPSYFGEMIALNIENTFEEQVEIRAYLCALLKKPV